MMPSNEKKESFEQKRKRLTFVKVWVKNFLDANQKNNNILETFEKNHAELDLRMDSTVSNLLALLSFSNSLMIASC